MEKTLDIFKSQQAKNLEILNNLNAFLQQGEAFGIQMDPHLLHKLQMAKENASNGKLHIALIGGFSEGKTSIAAAWMEKLDKASMNISHQESSNEVKVYDVGSDFVLIDTPGLFGFKEQFDEGTQSMEKYKDMTKKYVSEAHLVLYVMNSTNPIKESHKQDLEWLFRTLNLLDRTVFVLSRFDEVADVEDEDDYQSNARVKCQNVASRLQDLIALTPQERDALSIVAVAANPFDMGTDYWLENPDKFRALSHIGTLQNATSEKIALSGGIQALSEETKKSVIRDILTRKLPVAVEKDERIKEEVAELAVIHQRMRKEMTAMQANMSDTRTALRSFVTEYFSELILQAEGLSMETYLPFFEREVGDNGIIISTRLQNEFDRRLQSVSQALEKMQIGYNAEISHYNGTLTAMGKQGLDYVVKSKVINNTTVIAARDGVVSLAKMVGLDLGKLLKFKPWGAVNLAKGLNGALSVVGLALEAWDSLEQAKREKQFAENIQKMVANFRTQREELLGVLNAPDYVERFFSGYVLMNDELEGLEQTLRHSKERQMQFAKWREQAEAIDAEFTRVNA
ncbi:LeoA/HP0731 family dynamin-like GTPase [Lelliottia sp. CFBP8978]|jgi:GTP-binding protein EngB required for normal cell division|uniref:LeoA/HP0731 family dynamin-like GTPase n=1 Tax=Lelliottia sp. CFBP8978 TaxID=3096522 RepID=UPI002A69BA04|nr:LeoA/HP0731 family dynamin-like GTPase [Lelliottia sp. CFBP8978]MDY1037334.1 LeoA/HP0731 family dynamin-like GTPase [Lelliottia sp. CFBP8978]